MLATNIRFIEVLVYLLVDLELLLVSLLLHELLDVVRLWLATPLLLDELSVSVILLVEAELGEDLLGVAGHFKFVCWLLFAVFF